MKKNSVILIVIFAMAFFASCNSLREKKDKVNDTLVVVYDDSNYENYLSDTSNAAFSENNLDTSRVIVKDTVNVFKDTIKIEPVMIENEDGSLKTVSDDEIKKEESKVQKVHVKKFYIIAGSFKEMNNAIRLRSFFKSKGYPAMVLFPDHGFNRVATGSYPNRASAEKDIKKFRSMNLIYEKEKIEYWLLWR